MRSATPATCTVSSRPASRRAPTYFLSLNQEDYAGALELCNGAEEPFRRACARGVGAQAMKENINDPKLVETACESGDPEQMEPCIDGLASLYTSHHGSQ